MTDANQPEVHRGLKDLCFDRSLTTLIDGRTGELRYRGCSIHDLAAHSSFEETAYLLLHGDLPTRSELDAFDRELKEARSLPDAIHDIIRAVRGAHPTHHRRSNPANVTEKVVEAILSEGEHRRPIEELPPGTTTLALSCPTGDDPEEHMDWAVGTLTGSRISTSNCLPATTAEPTQRSWTEPTG